MEKAGHIALIVVIIIAFIFLAFWALIGFGSIKAYQMGDLQFTDQNYNPGPIDMTTGNPINTEAAQLNSQVTF